MGTEKMKEDVIEESIKSNCLSSIFAVYYNDMESALRHRLMLDCTEVLMYWQSGRGSESSLADMPNWKDNYHRGGKTFNRLEKESTFESCL